MTTLTTVQLTKRWHTPLHLMNFLDDANEQNVLRTVGRCTSSAMLACRTVSPLPPLTVGVMVAQTNLLG
jgi:hypothetical protein